MQSCFTYLLFLWSTGCSVHGLIVTNSSGGGDGNQQDVTRNSYLYTDNTCDESKCVGWGLAESFGWSMTCYTGHRYPMACRDGYVPQIVPTEPIIYSDDSIRMPNSIQGEDVQEWYYYFTCCPPVLLDNVLSDEMVGVNNTTATVTRHCSDPIHVSNEEMVIGNNTTLCMDNIERPNPRLMFGLFGSGVICCDSESEDNNTEEEERNYLNDIDCVQFSRNIDFRPTYQHNVYDSIAPIYCRNQDEYHEFKYPRIIDDPSVVNLLSSYGIPYECCKTESNPLVLPFVKDTAFAWTIYPQIVVSILAIIVCIIVIFALTLPLWKRIIRSERDGNTRSTTRTPSPEPSYSNYNLYIVYLLIPDLLLNIYFLGMYSSYVNQQYNPYFNGVIIYGDGFNYEGACIVASSTFNLYYNSVIAYEVLILLRNSYNVKKCDPPSFRRVTFQAIAVYVFSVCVGAIHYKIMHDSNTGITLSNLAFSLVVTWICPTLFLLFVTVIIWYRKYMPSATGRMQELAWYFFRIIIVFIFIWTPGTVLIAYGAAYVIHFGYYRYISVGYLLASIQPIVSVIVAMTKSDVKKCIMDVVTLSFIFHGTSGAPTNPERRNNGTHTTQPTTMSS